MLGNRDPRNRKRPMPPHCLPGFSWKYLFVVFRQPKWRETVSVTPARLCRPRATTGLPRGYHGSMKSMEELKTRNLDLSKSWTREPFASQENVNGKPREFDKDDKNMLLPRLTKYLIRVILFVCFLAHIWNMVWVEIRNTELAIQNISPTIGQQVHCQADPDNWGESWKGAATDVCHHYLFKETLQDARVSLQQHII